MVEILLATYNGEKYLREQIESIINQDYKQWILTIRDDNSLDKTKKILEEYSKRNLNIKIIKDGKGNLGYKRNFEELLKNVSGDFIFLCDQDDIWDKKKISTCVKYLKKYKIVHHNAEIFYENRDTKRELYKMNSYKKSIRNFIYPAFTGCCMAFRKEILKDILPIPKNYPGHDTWIGLLLMNEVFYIEKKLIMYRRHLDNTSFTSEKSKNKLLKKISFRYYYIVLILLRIIKNTRRKK